MTPIEVGKVEWSKSKNSTENKNSRFWSQICDYCENTSLHGYRYLTLQSIHWVERVLWLLVHITAICAVSYIISELWDEYVSSPTITTVETANYPIWHVPFPAVAVCNINKISRKAAWELAEELSGNGSSNVEHTFNLLRYLGRLYDHEDQDLDMYDELHAILTADIDEEDEHLNETYFKNMKKLSPNCEELLVRCRWLGHIENCSKIFTPRVTMEGFCCTFNYIRDSDDFLTAEEDAILEENEEEEHHGDEEDEDEEEEGGHHDEGDELLVSAPGYEMGLSILVNPQLEDYYYPLIATYGIKILVFKSRDFPDTPSGGLIEKIVPPKREVFFRLEASSIYANSFVERFDLKQRGCIFRNELTGLFVDSYSFSDCLMDCRGRSIQALCQCIPFYLPSRGVHRDCDARDIPCLARHKEKWWTIRPTFSDPALSVEMEEAISCPDCFPTCDDITYEVQSAEAYLSGRRFNHSGFLEGIELQNHSVVHVFFGSKNSIRLKQDVLFYWYDLLSNFGSILGLFVGFSLLSIVEIVYFFTLRFYYALRSPRTPDVTSEKTDITGPTKLKVFGFVMLSSTATDILQIDKHEDVFAITGKTNSELHILGISKQKRIAATHNLTEMLKINQYFYMGMANKTLVVAADDYVPYVITRMHYGQMEVTGYMGELWLILQKVLQFRTVMKRATFEEGRRMLRSGEADVLLQPTVVTGNNIGVYDFTRPVAYSWYELYVRVPECEGSPDSYFTVWGLYLWISTLAIIIILIVSIRLMCNYGSFEENQSDANQTKECQNMEGSHVTLGICLLAVLGSLGSEGFQLRPCSTSGRVLMVTTLLFSLLLFNSYSAVLVASLAVTNTPLPFSDLDDVARKGTHALCVRNVSYAYMRLKEKEEDLEVAARWRRVVYRQPCGELTENRDLERVLCGWDVAVLETPSNMAVATQNSSKSCHMKQIRGKFFAVPVSLEFRARFPYTNQINNYIHRLHTSGILHYLRKKWTTHSPLVSEEESVPNTTVSLQHVQLILVLYATCILCSTFILVLEIAWHNKNLQERRFMH